MMNSRVIGWLTRGCHQKAGWCIRIRECGGIFEVDAIKLHGVGALLDLSVNGTDVLPHHTEEKELERRDEKYSDEHGRKAKAEGRPEDQFKNEVNQGNKERETGPKEPCERGQAKGALRMVDNAEHADVVEGVPIVLGDPELAGRLVVEEL